MLDSIEDVINGYSERGEVEFHFVPFNRSCGMPGCFVNSRGDVTQILP